MADLASAIRDVQETLSEQEAEINTLFNAYPEQQEIEFHPLVLDIARLLHDNKILLVPTYEFIRGKLDSINECKGMVAYGQERWNQIKEEMNKTVANPK